MKTLKNPFLAFIFLVILVSSPVFSQNQTDLTNITVGKSYKIVLFDDTEILGKILAADSIAISVLTENGSKVIIPRNNILYYTNDLNPSKYSFQIAFTGGVSLIMGDNTYYSGSYSNNSKSGMNLNLSGTYYLSDIKAFRLDVGYTYLKANYNNNYSYYGYGGPDPLHPSTIEGGGMGLYAIKGNLLFGRFVPEERVQINWSVGFGVHISDVKAITSTYYGRNYPDTSTWTKYTNYDPAKTTVNALLSVGASLGYSFTKHFGVKADAEFNFVTASPYIFYAGNSYFPLRAGLFYSF
jgi:hypothetical protein